MFGDRLKQARLAAGLSLRGLADRMDNYISAQVIHKYELNKATPGSDVLIKLSQTLGVKMEFFFRPQSVEIELSEPAYRKRATVSKKELEAIRAQAKERVEKYLEVESLFPNRFKTKTIPQKLRVPVKHMADIEELAKELRKHWSLGLDPIENVTEVLEDQGVKVVMLESDSKVDGLSCWANETIPVVVVNKKQNSDRLRLSLAHELGHLLLENSNSIDQEKAAYRFAGAFFAPDEVVKRELGNNRTKISLYELKNLRKKYGMSVQAWVHRLQDLQIISDSFAVQIFTDFRRQGIHTMEMGEPLSTEAPKRFERLVIQAVEEGLISDSRGAELLDLSVNELRQRIKGDVTVGENNS
jgi:Zn-dependent peptidase ImmA (M78 family)/transcriptional regulator with XRE-family HTH domain